MKKVLIGIAALLSITMLYAEDVVLNDPSDQIAIKISRDSVNRIVFPSTIISRQYSKEKGLVVQVYDNEAYLKYAPLVEQTSQQVGNAPTTMPSIDKVIYSKAKNAEVFFVTEGRTYSIVFKPAKIGPQTIRINDTLSKKKSIIKYETRDPYKKTLKKLSTDVLNDKVPYGYEISHEALRYVSDDLEVILEKRYRGTLYDVDRYLIVNKGEEPVSLDERNYISLAQKDPLFIGTFYERQLKSIAPMDRATLVIITKGGTE